ncbi:fibulin-2 isoform X2 [Ambystoma mexicanum]|uniref:fibulin-2 isoform X2 n=1 Tax=Ambystoma mexicanum TaxID=8296 RepID=UPI0037E7F1F3
MKLVDMYRLTHLGCLGPALLVLFLSGLSNAQKDCTGVECEPLQHCIEEVLESDACCASCLQRGCTCEGYQYYDCVNVGFRHGKVPEGESYFVDFGSTECSCPKGGGRISCQFIPCPELPANCIDVLQPADGCPQCGSIGCIQEDDKYVAGHTFQMPPCKVCHCPNSGGELMCYPLPECDAATFITPSKVENEDIDPESHYDDIYSDDQDAPESEAAQLESPKTHRSYITSLDTENSTEQDEGYAHSEKSILSSKLSESTETTDLSTVSYLHKPSTLSDLSSDSEENEDDASITETPDTQDESEPPTQSPVHESEEENLGFITEPPQAEMLPQDHKIQEQKENSTDKGDVAVPTPGQAENDLEESGPAASTEGPSEQESPEKVHGDDTRPSIRFGPTTVPPTALKDHSEAAVRQSQTLYQYEPAEETEDPNSIQLESQLQEGPTKYVIETCCAAGQQWAVDNGECVDIPMSEADSPVCRIAQNHCCVSYLKENSCVAGMIAAKEGDFCVTDDNDSCTGSYYKQCCDCCTLGLKVKSEGQTCESNPNLGYPCNQVMLSCCEGEDQLIAPGLKRQPEPEPTSKPEKVSGPLEHNEAFSVDNQEDSTDILPGDNIDECLLYPAQLCQHLCINTVGSYKCGCFPGYTMEEDGIRCKSDNEDSEGNALLLAPTTAPELLQENSVELPSIVAAPQLQEDKCKDNGPCKDVCSTVGETVVCSCSPGYTLMIDGVSCEDLDECLSGTHSCSRQESCVNTLGSFSCVRSRVMCAEGFILNRHRHCVDINECVAERHTCQRGERCINTAGSFTCLKEIVCESGYENKDDICVDIDECDRGTHDCKVNSICRNTKGSFYCESKPRCRDGFIQDPAGNCVDVNECTSLPEPCKVGFSCINTVGSYTCQRNPLMCNRGYHSSEDGSRCIDVDECQTGVHRCGEGQVCHNLPGTYHCDCKRGYQADAFGRTCIDINECWNYPGQLCQHNCENTPGSYHCSCSSGFKLAYDGKHCDDVNECESSPCSQECVNVYGSYQCYCRQGYQLAEDGYSCKDIDECVQSSGTLCTFRCMNVPGSYQCACPEQGYTMAANGRSCRDVDECSTGSHNCSSAESCYNIQGSYRCLAFACPENYRKVADICERVNCLNYVDCQNTPVRITYYQLTFPSNIVVPSHIFRIGPSPAYAGDNIILTITKGNEENYFSTRKLNQYTGIVFIQRQIKEPKDFLLDVEMKLWRQGTYTTFLAKMYVFITDQTL